jgi:hypothetical protein
MTLLLPAVRLVVGLLVRLDQLAVVELTGTRGGAPLVRRLELR